VHVRGKKHMPVSTPTEITGSAIKSQGTATLPAVLSGAPGVIVTSGNKGESRIQIRGFQSQQTLVLLDGRPIALPYYGDIDLSTIPLSNVSKVSVVKGPAPALYGANGMGGVVNIVSQRIAGSPVREARFSVGENGGSEVLVNYGAARDKLDWWISAGRSACDGYDLSDKYASKPLEDGGLRYNTDFRHLNVDAKLNYALGERSLLSVSAGVYDAERGLASGTDKPIFQRYPYWRRWYTDLGSDGRLGRRAVWRAKVYYDDCENRLLRYSDSAMTDSALVFDSYHDSYDLGAVLGVDADLSSRMHNAISMSMRRDGVRRQENVGEAWVENHQTTFSVGDQFEYTPLREVRAEIGVGYHRMQSNSDRANIGTLDFNSGIVYSPMSWLDVQIAGSRSTRFPTLNQLYSGTSGNADLEEERAVKWETGYRLRANRTLTFSQTYFVSDVSNLIDRRDKFSKYENIENVDLSGLESEVGFDKSGVRIALDYVYLHAIEHNVSGSTETADRRAYSPRHKVDYVTSVRFRFGLEVTHTGQWISDRVGGNRKEMPDYFVAYVMTRFRITPSLAVFLNARNLTDRNFEEELYYPMPGRQLTAGIEVRI
jgi:iron complex outermembrane receptor protein